MKTASLKFKSRLVLLLIGTFVLSTIPSFAQSLEGKWNIAKINTRHSTLIQFTKDSLIFYEFDKRQSATSYHVKNNRLVVDNSSIPIGGTFEFVNSQRLRLKPDRAKSPIDFVRLKPTKTTLTRSEIEQLSFKISYKNRTISINFDDEKDKLEETTQLESIDSTYFLSFYQNNKRRGAMPIEQISTKKIVVYGFPEAPFVVSNGNAGKTNNVSSSKGTLTTAEAIIGKWFYKSIQGRPSLSACTKKTFFQFSEDSSIQTKPYAENFSNGNCIAGSSIKGTYEVIGVDEIKVVENGRVYVWKIKSLSKTKLVVERDGEALTLTKE